MIATQLRFGEIRETAFSMNRRNTDASILDEYDDEDDSSYEQRNKVITKLV
jgi:hypothetical protein